MARSIQSPFLNRIQSFRASISISISCFNQIFGVTIPILTNLLQLKKTDPFSTHPITMCIAVSSTVLFYFAYVALLQFPPPRRRHRAAAVIADRCLLFIGNVSVASLASVLFPGSWSPFVFAVFGVMSAAELVFWLCNEEFGIWRMCVIPEMFDNILTVFGNLNGAPQPILPI